ncbi:MAG: PIN domain-containing protein [Nitrospirota bacterium]
MNDRVFIDTNLWVYLHADDSNKEKTEIIKSLVDNYFENIIISTQVLGEFFHILSKKGLKGKEEARQMVLGISSNFNVVDVLYPAVIKAMDISILNGFTYWDSLILAVALENKCSMLYTEDMQHGQSIEGKLTIKNPFKQIE